MSTTALMAAATICFAGAAGVSGYLWHNRRKVDSALQVTQPRPLPKLRQGQLAVLDGQTLLDRSGMRGTLAQIRERSGLAAVNFEQDLQPVLVAIAAFVQRLPASEAHHHAQPGGLLVHIVEVADAALRLRAGRVLPVGAPIEHVARLQHRWTYAVCLAALLHDIGRPMSDLRIQYFRSVDGVPSPWMPLAGSLEAHGAVAYTVEFPSSSERDYQAHQRLPVILMQQLVPRKTLMWLAEDPALIRELNAFLSGQPLPGSAIADIVVAADQASVKANLVTGPRTRFKTARAVPLIERLMRALRRMLVDGTLPINQIGYAAGWSDTTSMWLVPKTVADAVRDYLAREEAGEGAGTGIPGDNNRLFDTWQEYGAVRPNQKGGALWDIEIRAGEQVKALNALCFPLEKLYQEPSQYPRPFSGEIRPVAVATGPAQAVAQPSAEAIETADCGATAAGPAPSVTPAASIASAPAAPVAAAAVGATPEHLEPVSESPTIERAAAVAPEPIVPSEVPTVGATRVTVPTMKQSSASLKHLLSGEPPAAPREGAVQVPGAVVPVDPYASMRDPLSTAGHPVAAKLMSWLQQGIASGSIPFNNSGCFVHFVPDGMLLVSPKVFKLFQREFGVDGEGAGKDQEDGFAVVQSSFIKSGWARRRGKKDYLHKYVIDGGRAIKPLSCLLVSDPQRWFQPVPAANPVLRAFDPTRDEATGGDGV
ncbi:MobH family relaxase [Burkholderia glumae]|uniref:MobH family relaxase n=1 Tax=Burkholderia glumae TaxID=337 RepID=UPI00214A87BC|nr:MobH family relaxase [Burkholderia glumae]MCR1769787.1 TraI domain-containing protein [Burkholderia glumae]